MAKTEAPTSEVDETMIDKILEIFQSNRVAVDYGSDPDSWVEENLPEGTEAADVAGCMPEVTERLGGPYQANAVRYNAYHGATAEAATHSVVNEISYTYNTIYQQNTFIYAEEGAQVVNIQGDGNHVTQTQIDLEFDVDEDQYDDDYENDEGYEGEETPVDEHDEPELPEDGDEDTDTDDTDTDPWAGEDDPTTGEEADPIDPVDPVDDNPFDDPAVDPAGEPADVPEGAEAL
jgi:hypothetical protein